jgi:DNA-directed RNA polymerase subunit RPC12/RpoP
MMNLVDCPDCGRINNAALEKCHECGKELPSASPSKDRVQCPYCSEYILASAQKCRFCREFLTEDDGDSSPYQTRETVNVFEDRTLGARSFATFIDVTILGLVCFILHMIAYDSLALESEFARSLLLKSGAIIFIPLLLGDIWMRLPGKTLLSLRVEDAQERKLGTLIRNVIKWFPFVVLLIVVLLKTLAPYQREGVLFLGDQFDKLESLVMENKPEEALDQVRLISEYVSDSLPSGTNAWFSADLDRLFKLSIEQRDVPVDGFVFGTTLHTGKQFLGLDNPDMAAMVNEDIEQWRNFSVQWFLLELPEIQKNLDTMFNIFLFAVMPLWLLLQGLFMRYGRDQRAIHDMAMGFRVYREEAAP